MAHTKKYILEHYECDGQLSIDDLPFQNENVDNFVTDVDNLSERLFERNQWIYGPHNPCCAIDECVGCLFGCYLD